MTKYLCDGITFGAVEQDFYIDPPELPEGASEKETKAAWARWIKENAKRRATHKALFTRGQKIECLSDFEYTSTLVKRDGVHRQQSGNIGFAGNAEAGTGELVIAVPATQDRHFRKRGGRSNKKGNKHSSTRANRRKTKRNTILSKKKI